LKAKLEKILKELFALGGNHNVDRMFELRDDFLAFLGEEEQIFMQHDDDNIVIAKDAIRFIDSATELERTSDDVKAGAHMRYFYDRMIDKDRWHYYELKILAGSLNRVVDVNQTFILADKAIEQLRHYQTDIFADVLAGVIAYHVLTRIFLAKFYEVDTHGIDLDAKFESWLLKLKLQLERTDRLAVHYKAVEIKQALFGFEPHEVERLMQELKSSCDEKIFRAIESEINFYMGKDRYTQLYKKKLLRG